MTSFEFGDVLLVGFPFTNQIGQKKRPAVVVSSTSYHRTRPDVISMAITSQVRMPQ
jgi:mRNA interferase MazF